MDDKLPLKDTAEKEVEEFRPVGGFVHFPGPNRKQRRADAKRRRSAKYKKLVKGME